MGVISNNYESTYTGKKIAGETIQDYRNTYSSEKQRQILLEGIQDILDSREVSRDEKNVAVMGNEFNKCIPSYSQAAEAMYKAVSAISNAPYANVGQLFTGIAVEAFNRVDGDEVRRNVAKIAFNAINDSYKTADEQKELANLGINYADETMENRDAAMSRKLVLDALSSYYGGPIGAVMANLGVKVSRNASNPALENKFLVETAKAITNSRLTSYREKDIAREVIDYKYGNIEDRADERRRIMRKIEDGGYNPNPPNNPFPSNPNPQPPDNPF